MQPFRAGLTQAMGAISVAVAPANCWLEPEPELAPIQAEPSCIWSSHHFSRLPLSWLGLAKPAKPPFFVFLSHPLCPSSPSSWLSCPSHAQPILLFLHNFLSSQVTEAFHRTFRQVSLHFQPKFYLQCGHHSHQEGQANFHPHTGVTSSNASVASSTTVSTLGESPTDYFGLGKPAVVRGERFHPKFLLDDDLFSDLEPYPFMEPTCQLCSRHTLTPHVTSLPIPELLTEPLTAAPLPLHHYLLLAFSVGQLLKDNYLLAWYGLYLHKLLKLHPPGTIMWLQQEVMLEYIKLYYLELDVRALCVITNDKDKDSYALSSISCLADTSSPNKIRRTTF